MRGERALSFGVTLAAAGAMSLSPENSQAQNAPGIDPFEHANTQGSIECVRSAFLQSSPDGTPIAAAMVDSNGNAINEAQICDVPYTNAVTVDEAIRTGLLNPSEVPNDMGGNDIYITWSDRSGTPPQKGEIPARDPYNASGNGGDGDGKPNGERFGKQIPQGAEFQAEIPPTPTPAAVVENIGSPDLNLIATMNELAPGAYDQQIQYALGMLNIQNPQSVVEVSMNGNYNFKNRVVYVDGAYYVFDSTQESPLVTQTGGTYFDIEEAFGIEHWVTVKGDPNIRPEPGTAQDNTPVGQAANGTRLRVVGEPKDDPDPNQSRDWIPILWDPDGDGNGEQGHVASDFTNGMEKVVGPDAVVREVTPEQALIESIASFSPTPNIVDQNQTYEVRYSSAFLEDLGLSNVSANTRDVSTVLNDILRKLSYATDNVQGGDNIELGSLMSFITLSRGSDNGEKVTGQLNAIRQYVFNKTEFIALESILSGDEARASRYLNDLGINRDSIQNDNNLPDYIKFYAIGNGQQLTAGIVMFGENNTLYILNAPYTANSDTQGFLLMYGPAMLDYLLTEYSADAQDTEIYAARFSPRERRRYDAAYRLKLNMTALAN